SAAAAPTPAVPPASVAVAESKPAPAVSANEKERYQAAYDTLRNGHNAQAVKMFQDLLRDFPAGEFADNSQYWLAEAYKINREFDAARAAFNKVVSQYPNSSKVPDALLKLGYIEFDLQNAAKARDYLTRVTTSYPGTTAAHLAEKKLAQMSQ
ncbi:tol-pal system protein YbgF, partial [Methylomonas koyamae]